jgi:FKBP-type peptidyl-prolyl cis-trans isomerase
MISLVALTAVVAACGEAKVPTIEETTFAASLAVNLATMTKSGSGLYTRDLVVGTGATATNGKQVGVHYEGFLTNGTRFDANLAGATPFSFQTGTGAVIPGFNEGVTGMKVGGRRQIIIPPSLAYGAEGMGIIPKNAILVFTLDLVSVN